ncbi:MAG: BTAD domain-containing putative transcriptional regulator, partial [Anaerolineae bacterium]
MPPIASTAARSLFAYLVTYRDRPHTRDLLAGIFWMDVPDTVARRRLSQSLWQIGKALRPHCVLLTEGDTVQLNPDLPLWVDVAEFQQARAEAEAPLASGAIASVLDQLQKAANLYRGPFLSGYYDDWVLPERERLREGFLEVLEKLVAGRKQQGAYDQALTNARRLAAEDPWREEAHREVMRLCHLLGRDHAALQQFELCRRVLEEELDAEPSAETAALAAVIADREAMAEYSLLPSAAPPTAAPFLERPDRLPLVGRHAELRELLRQLESAMQGAGGLTLVCGEAGVGKTRLLSELESNARWRGVRTLWGLGYELADPPAYQPLIEVLRTEITGLQQSSLGSLWRVELARLLPEMEIGDARPTSLEPEEERRRLSEAIVRAFLALSETGPCLILLESAQWMDVTSLETIRYLLPRLTNAPLMVVITVRPEELRGRQARIVSALESTRLPRRLELDRLELSAAEELVAHALGLEQPAPIFSARLHEETEGNPFFLIETLRALVDEGLLYCDEEGDWSTPWDEETTNYAELPLPASVLQSIERRLDRLSPRQSELLGLAAIIGRRVTFDLWHLASEMDARDLLDVGDELCRRGVLLANEAELEEADYVFAHDQIRRVAHDRLAAPRRRLYHQRVAEALERLAPDDAEALAYHWTEAKAWAKAVDYHQLAGERARVVYANDNAVAHFGKALESLDHVPGAWDTVLRYELHLARERVRDLQGEREAQAKDLDMLAGLARQLGDAQRQAVVALRQAHYADRTSDYPAAIAAAEQAIRFSQTVPDLSTEVEGLICRGKALTRQGSYGAAQSELERAIGLIRRAEAAQEPPGPLHDLETECLRSLGASLWCLGQYAAARRRYEQCIELCRERGDRRGESLALSRLGVIHAEQGDYDAAQTCYRHAAQICHEIGHRFGEANIIGNSGIVFLYQGAHGDARDLFEQSLRICREIGHRRAESIVSTYFALLFHRLDDNETARQWGERALAMAQELGDRPVCSDASTNLAHALAALGHLADAAKAYSRAFTLRHELGETNRAMESRAGLASVLLAQGDTDGARLQVEQILDHLESGSLDGADEPFRIYYTCYRVLSAPDDPRAQDVLSTAYRLLQEQASKIGDQELRRSFLQNIPHHRAIVASHCEQQSRQITVRLARADAP